MSQIRNAIVFACSLAAVSGTAHADDQGVIRRLASNGGLSSSNAKQLVAKVGKRLARAADAPSSMIDPLRSALSQALIGTPVPPDQISAAKVRLKLYAGLNEFALEAIFAPKPGAIGSCVRDVGVTQNECESLVAAAGKMSVSQARNSAGGSSGFAAGGGAPMQGGMAPMQGGGAPMQGGMAQPAAGGSRFGGRFDSGYQGRPAQQGYAQQGYPQQQGYQQQGYRQQQGYYQQPQQQQRYAAPPVQQQQRFGAQAPAANSYQAPPPQRYAAPAAAPAYVAAAPMVNSQDASSRREAYKAQRDAYMARQKAQFEERRAKSAVLEGPPPDAPPPAAAPAPAPQRGAAKASAREPEPATPLDSDMAAAVPEPAAKATGGNKAGLDGDFLDGLLDDPTGKSGKKK